VLRSSHMNQFDILPFELRKLGLTEREAKIYLASLELVQATAYEISTKVNTSRPTVYRVLKDLEKKKLVSQTKNKNKNYFTASSPEELLCILKMKRREAEEQEREFLRIISVLQTKYSAQNKCATRIYKGPKSHKGLLEIFSTTPSKKIKVIFLGNKSTSLQKEYAKINKRLRSIEVKELYFGNTVNKNTSKYVQQKTLDTNPSPSSSMTLIITDRIIVLKKNMGLQMENDEIKDVFELIFNSMWK
jgi:sugar-specific transcriptional regulator TrmB